MSILTFQKPERIVLQKANDFEGTFEFRPLEPGYGVTVGNALRRILLSSLEGYAITAVKISGVDHEFSTIKGVIEDVTEIILNLKQVRFKKTNEEELTNDKIFISLNKKDKFVAGDIEKQTTVFTVTNPDLVICHLDSSVKIEVEITVQKGRGYLPAEEQKLKDVPTGTIPMDAIFTPIKNVKYNIENTRVEQKTDYEKLIIDIATDGTIHPEEAIKEAAKIMMEHLMLISDKKFTFDVQDEKHEDSIDEETLHMRKMLSTPLEDLDLSVRAYNCLKAAKIESLAQLVQFDTGELLKFRNFGKKSLMEIEQVINEKGLHFGMDLTKFKLDGQA